MSATALDVERNITAEKKLEDQWHHLLQLIEKKDSSTLDCLKAVAELQKRIDEYFTAQNKANYGAEDKAQLIQNLSLKISLIITDLEEMQRFFKLKDSLLSLATPEERKKLPGLYDIWNNQRDTAIFYSLGTSLAFTLDLGIKPSQAQNPPVASSSNALRPDDYKVVQSYYLNTFHPHLAILATYRTAFVQSLSSIVSQPEKVLYHLYLLFQQLKHAYPELRQLNLDNNTTHGEKAVEQFVNIFSTITANNELKPHLQQLQDALAEINKDPAVNNASTQKMLKELNFFSKHFLKMDIKKPQQKVSQKVPVKQSITPNPFNKIFQKFAKRHEVYQQVCESKNPFTTFPFSLSQLADFFKIHEKKTRLPITFLAEYLLTNPQEAAHYLEPRSFIGMRNYRRQICQNPVLLHMLIERGDSTLLEAIKKSRILASTHLKIADQEIKILNDKLDMALTVASEKQATPQQNPHKSEVIENYMKELGNKQTNQKNSIGLLNKVTNKTLAQALVNKLTKLVTVPLLEKELHESIAVINHALSQGPLTANTYNTLITFGNEKGTLHPVLRLDNAVFPQQGFTNDAVILTLAQHRKDNNPTGTVEEIAKVKSEQQTSNAI